MSLIKFITSKTFFKQVILAVIATFVLCFVLLKWLNISTNHGDFETVPNLKGKSMDVAKMEIEANNLELKIQDSANFNPKYPRYSVIDQDPKAGDKVKENRKIYITLNPSGYRKMEVPELNERTFRQAKPTLEAIGFEVGTITYVDNIGRDIVLKMTHNGKEIKAGDLLPKTSKIDLTLGNGQRPN
jgi:beta-lactam-binding protein with PASTA domain